MIYLLGQMSLIILLAAVAGGALGWAIHRLRNQQNISDLRRVITQQQQQVKQAQTDVSMLAQDYDELKQTSSSAIDNLRSENRQIPNLHQNLEKSQLLVRQLMQKHEAQIREYASENETLKAKVKHLDDREQALNKLQSDVEQGRKALNEAKNPAADGSKPASETKQSKPAESQTTENSPAQATTAVSSKFHKSSSQSIAELTAKAQAKAKQEKEQHSLSFDDDADDVLDLSADVSGEAGSLTVALAEADVVLAAIDKKREDALTIEDDEVINASDFDLDAEFADEDELEMLFDPVDQHDDLQTIFGIGPVTERGLNQLGITSYSQLADLKRHDIEKIAGALEIVPGKIERENWVGNARRQLEDVLEEL